MLDEPSVSIHQYSDELTTTPFVASQLTFNERGLPVNIHSSSLLDLNNVLDSKIIYVTPISSSNITAATSANSILMLTSMHNKLSTLLAYNIVPFAYSAMDKITGLKIEEATIGAFNLGNGVTLQITSHHLAAVAGNNSSNKLLWSVQIHSLLSKYASVLHPTIIYDLRKKNASINRCSMLPNILYLSMGRHVIAIFLSCDQIPFSISSGDGVNGGAMMSFINKIEFYELQQ